jgi:hypothetical protein
LAVQSGASKFPAQGIKTLLKLHPNKTGAVSSFCWSGKQEAGTADILPWTSYISWIKYGLH